ncbi:uncharacterized protein J7T54_004676 [Emericellopsis cladophorae]|uniref:Rhodopsin domain-containing protein n=1 Tax=Emericellopsis cladophorae TaxID=2686198 RepID=A0A9Q0BGW9_9HYPO|nr:uncharacterized protein J7T54_004676 [Emericellopsis cladophorae]KAI6784130.1 hypothetical protein J7T54_004676 [Emericellopsis cladophorae]
MAPAGQGPMALAIMWTLTAITLVFVALRVYTRQYIIRMFGADDVAYVVAGLFLLLYTTFLQVSLRFGFGQSIQALELEDIALAIKWEMVGQTFAVLGMAISKASLGLFLLRFVVERWQRIVIWAVMLSLLGDSALTAVVFWVQCIPVEAIYDPRVKTPELCTIPITPFAVTLGVWCIVADFFFAIFPVIVIWGLNMKKKEKIIIAASMSLGVFAGAAGIIRTYEVAVGFTANYTEDTVALIIWSAVEMHGSLASTGEGSYQKQKEDSGRGLYELNGMPRTHGKKNHPGNELKLGVRTQTITEIETSNDNDSDEHILSSRGSHRQERRIAGQSDGIHVQDDVKVEWRWTRLWYLYQVWTGDSHLELKRLHEKHGPIIRIAPHIIDIDMPELIQTIYNTKGDWLKTEFYHGSSALVNGKIVLNLFSQTNPAQHAKERKPIAKHYSSSATTALEPHMDKVIDKLCHELEVRFIDVPSGPKAFDLGKWILFYTWDIVGAVTFSQPIGYLDKGEDFDGTLYNADKAMDYFAVVGTMPFLDRVFDKNPIYRIGPPGFNTITGISVQHLIDRSLGKDKDMHDPNTPDFLDKFIETKKADPENVDDGQIISWLMVNMIAGADTTAITIRSALYYALKHPRVWQKLTEEVLTAGFRGRTPPPYKDARALPYVDAVIREALRVLPGVSMTLERYVPRGGYSLPSGDYLPEGAIVGMNPYITNRNKAIFGEDADDFRPERWLWDERSGETEEVFQARLTRMNKADLSFGAGSRLCVGKNMGLFQTYKVLVTLITLYDFKLTTDKEWKVINSFFARQEGFEVSMWRR